MEYEQDEKIFRDDPCQSCFCLFGRIICSSTDCAFPDPALNCTEIPKEGSCCPEFVCPQDEKEITLNFGTYLTIDDDSYIHSFMKISFIKSSKQSFIKNFKPLFTFFCKICA